MLHIEICDDEKDFVTRLTDLLNRYVTEIAQRYFSFADGGCIINLANVIGMKDNV